MMIPEQELAGYRRQALRMMRRGMTEVERRVFVTLTVDQVHAAAGVPLDIRQPIPGVTYDGTEPVLTPADAA